MAPLDGGAAVPQYYVETIHAMSLYSKRQMQVAILVAAALDRGKLVLCEHPDGLER